MAERFMLLSAMLIAIILLSSMAFADETISGHYCYTYGDSESLKEAREVTKTLALRNAIESYRIFIESTTQIKNYALTNDIVQMLSSGYLKDITVVKHDEQGRTVCDTIKAVVTPSAINNFVKREIAKRYKDIEDVGVDNNDCLKILSTKRNPVYSMSAGKPCSKVSAVIKVIDEKTYCDKTKMKYVYIDYFDSNGNPEHGDKIRIGDPAGFSIRDLDRGEIRTITFDNVCIYENDTYRVWLQK